MHVGRKQRQIGIVAPVQRQLDDLLGVDDLPVFARVGVYRSRGAHDIDDVADYSHLHRDVDALPRIDVDDYVCSCEARETGELRRDGVTARLDVEEVVTAAFIGDRFGYNPGVLTGKRHIHFRHDGACTIAYGTQDFGGLELRIQRKRDDKKGE